MTMTMTPTADTTDPLAPLKSQIIAALSPGGAKSLQGGPSTGAQRDSALMACSLLASMTGALAQRPNLVTQVQPTIQKAFAGSFLQDPTQLTDKAWWNDVLQFVQDAAPIALSIFNAVGGGQKDFTAVANSPVAQRHANDKDWQNFVADMLTQITPMLVHALRGTKDFRQPGALTLNIRQPANIQGDQKGWFDDAISFVSDALPVVLPIVMALI